MRKNIKNITAIMGLLLVLNSCSDWLDETSSTQVSADEQFDSLDGFKDALMGVYIGLTQEELYSRDMTYNIVDLLSQQYAGLPTLAKYDEVQRFEYSSERATSQIDALWIKSYNVVANINLALEYIDKNKNKLNPIDYSIIKGELLGLRVFLHLDIMRLYGYGNLAERENLKMEFTIPYVTVYTKDVTSQLSYNETFALMEQDLQEAVTLLKEDPIYNTSRDENYYFEVNRSGFYNNREQRMNYYAVKAVQARLLQWEGKYAQAAAAADEVIKNSFTNLINPATYDVESDPILYPEVLFSLDVDGLELISTFYFLNGSVNYDLLSYTSSSVNTIFETNNVNIGLPDVRYNTMLKAEANNIFTSKKVFTATQTYHNNQLPLIKLPEMYYIMAEYYITENPSLAIEYLNTVREHRGILADIPDTETTEELQEELMKEYRKEFLTEGQLFFFYKRTGATDFLGLPSSVEANDDIYVLPYPDNEVEFGNR